MLKTILLLIFGLLLLPWVAYTYDAPLAPEQKLMLMNMVRLMLGVGFTCFLVSELTRNYSQVDKLWSIMPIVYTWYFAGAGGWDSRMVLMAVLATIWGLRLSYNFWRRGGYRWPVWEGEEDYRWGVLRQMPLLQGRLRWGLFNFFFYLFLPTGSHPAVHAACRDGLAGKRPAAELAGRVGGSSVPCVRSHRDHR